MPVIRQCALLLVFFAGSGCASHKASTTTGKGPPRWSGSFKQESNSAVIGAELARGRSSGYGTIVLTPVADQARRVKAELSVNTSLTGTQIAWAVYEGTCGAPTPPVLAVNEFPTIEIGTNGAGVVRAELPVTLNVRGTYHANVYWSNRATDVSNVMLCTNLAYAGTR
jgi:hypothetical protein